MKDLRDYLTKAILASADEVDFRAEAKATLREFEAAIARLRVEIGNLQAAVQMLRSEVAATVRGEGEEYSSLLENA
jgi:hypothetical protein